MDANEMDCQKKVFLELAQAGVEPQMLSDDMSQWLKFSCLLGMPEQEISRFLVRALDWASILESISDYDLTADELAELKKGFFAGKLRMKEAVDQAKAKSDQKAKLVMKPATRPKGQGDDSSR